jgi:hypothetical protein
MEFLNTPLEFGAEVPDQTLHGPRSGVTQCANGMAFDFTSKFLH